MTSIWKIANQDIYVNTYDELLQPHIAELNPINSTESTYHWVFTPDKTVTIVGTVIGSGYLAGIQAASGGLCTLITDLVPAGITVLLVDVKASRESVVCQRVDLSQPTTAPVYTVTCMVRT